MAKERMRGIENGNLWQLVKIWVIDGGIETISRSMKSGTAS
jgi:hypothetical protein